MASWSRSSLALALVACSAKARLVSEADVTKYEADLLRRLDANAKRVCARKPLRGAPAPGSASGDLFAFHSTTGELARCLGVLTELARTDLRAQIENRTRPVLDFDEACGATIESAMHRATSYGDACSPFQIGVRPQPDTFLRVLRIADAMGLRARTAAARNQPGAGLWLSLETVRFAQDYARGHTPLLNNAIGKAMSETALHHAQAILLEQRAIGAAQLGELAAAVDALIASEPPIADALQAEREYTELYFGLVPLKPVTWPVPGGWIDGLGDRTKIVEAAHREAPSFSRHPRDGAAMWLVAGQLDDELYRRGCAKSLRLCRDALAHSSDSGLVAQAKRARDQLATRVGATRVPAEIVDHLEAARSGRVEYVATRAGVLARLAALRLHLEVLRTKQCPKPGTHAGPAALGDDLALVVVDKQLEVSAPKWTQRPRPLPPWRIPCP
ncbi:MAG TPA: hypothetical protein VIU61_00150 [Kofleriaceae bacterium]